MDVRASPNLDKSPVCPYCKDQLAPGRFQVCSACGVGQHGECSRIHGACAVCAAPVGASAPVETAFSAWLGARVESGAISEEQLWVAAALGHASAVPLLRTPRLIAALALRDSAGMDLSGNAGEFRGDPRATARGLIAFLELVSKEASWRARRAALRHVIRHAEPGADLARLREELTEIDAHLREPPGPRPCFGASADLDWSQPDPELMRAIHAEVFPWALGLSR